MAALTHEQLIQALKARYSRPSYAFFSEVSHAVGFSSRMDALAMAMWRSLGLEIHGFEIKCHRSDWLREKKRPFKAEAAYSFCDRWWLVLADKAIIKPDELPTSWGLLLPGGEQLITAIKAPRLQPRALDRDFVAAILRKAHDVDVAPARWLFRPASTAEEIEHCERSIASSLSNVSRKLSYIAMEVARLQKKRLELARNVNLEG